MPSAEAHTPYGMTEALPVADISLDQIDEATGGDGVCVGRPLPGVDVMLAPLDHVGRPAGEPTRSPGVVGEVIVRAPHVKDHYDRLWATQHASERPPGWQRTGEVGHLDDTGLLWIGGRLVHVITTAGGPVAPVSIEHAVEELPGVADAAVVGVGPPGAQQLVVVIVPEETSDTPRLADIGITDAVRAAVAPPVAAVLVVDRLPVDIRHNSKIDRGRVKEWAESVLAGGRMTSL